MQAEQEIKRLEELNKSTLDLHENEIRTLNSKIDELNVRIEKMVTNKYIYICNLLECALQL